jgi:phospholipid transport system transporter-binding protein
MTPATLEASGDGRFQVRGPMVFRTAGDLLASSEKLFRGAGALVIDLSAVTNADSAGLALLIEWLRTGQAEGRSLGFVGVPEKLEAIARLSGVAEMLGEASATPAPAAA